MEVSTVLKNLGLEPSLEVLWDDIEALSEDVFAGNPIVAYAPGLAYDAFNRFIQKPFGERITLFTEAVNKPAASVNSGFTIGVKKQLAGKTFVITGKLGRHWAQRADLEYLIQQNGGFVKERIGRDTDYLITNTPNSGTKKNKDADMHCVPKITEDEFYRMFVR